MPGSTPAPVVAPVVRAITIRRRLFGFVVSPGIFRIDPDVPGETPHIKMRNQAQIEARVTFDPNRVQDEKGDAVTTFDLAPGGKKRLKVVDGAPDFFEYRVEMLAAGIEAQGNSRPGVEIVR